VGFLGSDGDSFHSGKGGGELTKTLERAKEKTVKRKNYEKVRGINPLLRNGGASLSRTSYICGE